MAKDTAMNIRVSSQDLELIKKTAKANGYDKYSEWCLKVILNATGKTPIEDEIKALRERIERLEKLNHIQVA